MSGRLLVGLRWWNQIQDDGSSVWMFESVQDDSVISYNDSVAFWGALFLNPLVWLFFGLTAVFQFSFEWLLLVIVALALSGANILGYLRCKKDARTKIQGFLARNALSGLTQVAFASVDSSSTQ